MTDKMLMHDIEELRKRQPLAFWGLLFAIGTILYGEFIVRVDGYLLAHTEPYFAKVPEDLIGYLLIGASLIKVVGVILNSGPIKRIGIISMSAVWTGVFVLATTYSFGTGYPHPSYIFMGIMMIGCYRISRKGDFGT